jgi:hypothetical protein
VVPTVEPDFVNRHAWGHHDDAVGPIPARRALDRHDSPFFQHLSRRIEAEGKMSQQQVFGLLVLLLLVLVLVFLGMIAVFLERIVGLLREIEAATEKDEDYEDYED